MKLTDKESAEPTRVLRVELGLSTMLIAVFGVGLVWLLLQLWPVLLVIVVALMITGMLGPPVTWLEGKRVSRGWSIALVFIAMFASVALFSALTVPKLVAEASAMAERLPQAQADIGGFLEKSKVTEPLAKSVRGANSSELMAKATQLVVSYSGRAVEVGAYAVTALFLALYLMIDRDRMRGAAFALVPRSFHVRLSRILLNLETIVGGYLRGQVITSIMMAVFTFAVLSIARVPNAIALAALAGLADVLPYVGAILACGPAVLAAMDRGTPTALAVFVALAVYQEIESRLIVPRIYGRVLRLPAATVMVSLLIGGTLLGVLGALLALPIAAGIRMIVEELRLELPGEGHEGDAAVRKRDARDERVYEKLTAGAPAEEAAGVAAEVAKARIDGDAAAGRDPTTEPVSTGPSA